MSLIDFYKKVIESLGLIITEDGFIKMKTDSSKNSTTLVLADKNPMVLPTREHLESLTADVDGETVPVKTLFNPLYEDPVKGDSSSLRKIKQIIDTNLSFATMVIVDGLLELGSDKELQKKASLSLNSFIGSLKSIRTTKASQVIDPTSKSNWLKLYSATTKLSSDKGIVHIYLKKGGKLKSDKFNRLAVATFPLYKELLKVSGKPSIHGVKLRPKDVNVFKALFQYIFEGIDEAENFMFGSSDKVAPSFVALFTLYFAIAERLNSILDDLTFVDKEIRDAVKFNITLSMKAITDVSKYQKELALIPSDLTVSKLNGKPSIMDKVTLPNHNETTEPKKVDVKSILAQQQMQQQVPQQNNIPAQMMQQSTQSSSQNPGSPELTDVQKILYGENGTNPMSMGTMVSPQQVGVYQQPQMSMQPQMTMQPTMQPQMTMQPQYQQPMMQPQMTMQPTMQPVMNMQPTMQPQMGMQQQVPMQPVYYNNGQR